MRICSIVSLIVFILVFSAPVSFAADATATPESSMTNSMTPDQSMEQGDFDDEYEEDIQQIADPFEPVNRFWFGFNDVVYTVLWKPVGTAYNYVTPDPIKTGVDNLFYNWKFPIRFVSNVLQGKFLGAGVEFSRFVANTAFGLGGMYDITANNKTVVEVYPEDFGQTLGVWGAGNGFYIVLPLFGPSTLRDTVGLGVDSFLDPVTYIDPWFLCYSTPAWISPTVSGVRAVTAAAANIDRYDELKASAVEPYSAFRNAYVQYREQEISR